MDLYRCRSTNLPIASRFPKVNVIPNLIGLKKTSMDCQRKNGDYNIQKEPIPNQELIEQLLFDGQKDKLNHERDEKETRESWMNFELLKIQATGAYYMITYQKGKSQARDQTYNKSIKSL